MGIHGLKQLIEHYAPSAIKNTHISNYRNKTIIKDTNNILYRMCKSMRKNGDLGMITKEGKITSHLHVIYMTLISCMINGIFPIYSFDGKAPTHKQNVVFQRKDKIKTAKNKFNNFPKEDSSNDKTKAYVNSFEITRKMFNECKKLLELAGIPYIQSPQEADSQCAGMVVNKDAYASVTEDLDHLVFELVFLQQCFCPHLACQ